MSSELTSLFGALVYVSPVLGAYVADVYLGRYRTIVVFCVLYIFGLALTTVGAWPTEGANAINKDLALGTAMVGFFVFIALGAGGIKSNVVVLGADQFKLPEQTKQQESFFVSRAAVHTPPTPRALHTPPTPRALHTPPTPRALHTPPTPRALHKLTPHPSRPPIGSRALGQNFFYWYAASKVERRRAPSLVATYTPLQ